MSEEEKKKKEGITFNLDQVTNLIKVFIPYYPMVKMGARLMGVKIPPEIDEFLDAISKGKPPDLDKLRLLAESAESKVGDPVMTRQLAEEAYFLHTTEGMGTRAIAEHFTNKLKSPCSHATVARWINLIDQQKRASKVAKVYQVIKYAGIAGILALSAYLGSVFF